MYDIISLNVYSPCVCARMAVYVSLLTRSCPSPLFICMALVVASSSGPGEGEILADAGRINIECKARQADISQETHYSLHPAAVVKHMQARENKNREHRKPFLYTREHCFMHVYICILNSVFSAYKCVQSKAALT